MTASALVRTTTLAGMVRYVLAVPAVFLLLARLGEHQAFDRVWTVISVMLMALLAALYSVDFWVA